MNLTNFINIPVFIVSLAIGMYGVYITNNSEKRKIMVYPTPDNIEQIQYRDSANNCFKFKQTQVNCPIDSKDISKLKAQ
jgi:hypothetical protein